MLDALRIMYGLTNDRKTNKKGIPKNIIHTAIGLNIMDAYSPKTPHLFQNIVISTLVILGKTLGIEKRLTQKYSY